MPAAIESNLLGEKKDYWSGLIEGKEEQWPEKGVSIHLLVKNN